MNWHVRSSGYDPDPAVLTGGIPGFAELANLYDKCCVHKMKLTIEVSNGETEGVVVIAWPSPVLQNVNSLTRADLAEYFNNPQGKKVTLGRDSALSTRTLTCTADGLSLVGSRLKTDLDFTSSTSSNPTIMWGINIGAFKHDSNFSYPLRLVATVLFDIEFFERRQLET